MGRPSSYTPELAALICERIVETGSLLAALKDEGESPELPAERTVYRWLAEQEEFRQMYAHAREVATEADSEEMRRVAYDPDIKGDDKRAVIDVLKFQMARRAPKKWGDRTTLSGDPDSPLFTASDEQIDARLAALLDRMTVEGVD